MNDINVLLGHNKDSLNYFFTVLKKYVYTTKCKEKLLSIEGFTNLIRHYYTSLDS